MLKNTFRKLKYFFITLKYNFKYIHLGLNCANSKENLAYQMLLYIHAIEKGLGLKNTRLGYGKNKILTLVELIEKWETLKFPTTDYEYRYSIDILYEYVSFHKKHEYNCEIIEKVNLFLNNRQAKCIESGFYIYNYDFDRNDFNNLITHRHSIRDFDNREVEKCIIIDCLKSSKLAPSACNRQSTKVYFSMNKSIINKIGEYIPGNTGFNNVNNYLIITADICAYGVNEYMQWMTNAGIYIAYLSLLFENKGVCNCICQWANINNEEQKLRDLLNIKDSEHIVAALAIGYPNNNCKVIKCTRRESVYKEIE